MLKFFSSSATNKVDGKGRVSIPAPFRKVLAGEDSPILFLMPELLGEPTIIGFGQSHFENLARSLTGMNPFSPEFRALADAVAGQAHQLPLDETGRIVLPKDLREIADIGDEAFFVGSLNTFQIWKPETYAANRARMMETARANIGKLNWGATMPGKAEP
ncbi:MAG: division/cell wall cluster transcriptional repressor MraZ [Pikeienuella sp.]